MKIAIIAAMDKNRGVGKENKIPWHITEDLVHLKNLTQDHVVILGRKTYESMSWYYDRSGRPMPAKLYIAVTRDVNYKPTRENATAANSLEEALRKAEGVADTEEVFINGGAQMFTEGITKADRLYLTIVEGDYDVDTYFPDYSAFKTIISEEEHVSKTGQKYKFLTLEK